MIYGVDTDLVPLKRIVRLDRKFGMSFAERIPSPEELLEFPQVSKPINYLTKRFVTREALAKAAGTGIHGAVMFRNIGVGHNALDKSEFFYAAPLAQWLKEQGIARVHLNMSDEEGTVLTFTVAGREAV